MAFIIELSLFSRLNFFHLSSFLIMHTKFNKYRQIILYWIYSPAQHLFIHVLCTFYILHAWIKFTGISIYFFFSFFVLIFFYYYYLSRFMIFSFNNSFKKVKIVFLLFQLLLLLCLHAMMTNKMRFTCKNHKNMIYTLVVLIKNISLCICLVKCCQSFGFRTINRFLRQ